MSRARGTEEGTPLVDKAEALAQRSFDLWNKGPDATLWKFLDAVNKRRWRKMLSFVVGELTSTSSPNLPTSQDEREI